MRGPLGGADARSRPMERSISKRPWSKSSGGSVVSSSAAAFTNCGWSRYPTGSVVWKVETALTRPSTDMRRRASRRLSAGVPNGEGRLEPSAMAAIMRLFLVKRKAKAKALNAKGAKVKDKFRKGRQRQMQIPTG